MKKIIITGCSGSIGSYLLNYYKKKKYKVIGLDINSPKVKGVDFYRVDLLNLKKLNNTYKKILKKYNKVNILINAAGFIHNELFLNASRSFKTHNYSTWKKVFKNNVDVTFLNSKIFINSYLNNFSEDKIIINFSSVNSSGIIGQSAYGSAKAAIETFTKVLSKELSSLNFRVACISPGYFNVKSTLKNVNKKNLEKIIENIPVRKLGNVKDIAHAIDFIIKNKYFNGKILNLDGGK